jgi:hypothetical protein
LQNFKGFRTIDQIVKNKQILEGEKREKTLFPSAFEPYFLCSGFWVK